MFGIALGGRVDERIVPHDAGVAFGGRVAEPSHCISLSAGGLALAARCVEYHYCPGEWKGGIALRGRVLEIVTLRSGFALGGVVTEPADLFVNTQAGLALGGLVTEPADLFVNTQAGLKLGSIVTIPDRVVPLLPTGLAFGSIVTEPPPTPHPLFGFALGGTVSVTTSMGFQAGISFGGNVYETGLSDHYGRAGLNLGSRVTEPPMDTGVTINATTNNIWKNSIILHLEGTNFTSDPATNILTLTDVNGDPVYSKVMRVTDGGTKMTAVLLYPETHVLGVVNAHIHNANGGSGSPVNVATFIDHTPRWLDTFTASDGTHLEDHAPDTWAASSPAYTHLSGGGLDINGNNLISATLPMPNYKVNLTQTSGTMFATLTRLTTMPFFFALIRVETSGFTTGCELFYVDAYKAKIREWAGSGEEFSWDVGQTKRWTVQWDGFLVAATCGGKAQLTDAVGIMILRWILEAGNYFGGEKHMSFDDVTMD